MTMKLNLISPAEQALVSVDSKVLQLANDADPREVSLQGVERIELNFP